MLRAGWLNPTFYWIFIFILLAILAAREILGAAPEARSQRWLNCLDRVAAPLLAAFLLYVLLQVLTLISQAFPPG